MTRNLPFCLAPTTPQLQINYIKFTQTLVTSSYVPNEDVWKVFWKQSSVRNPKSSLSKPWDLRRKHLHFPSPNTTLQLQINYIKSTQTFVTSSYVPNEDVCKVFLKTKECEKSEIIII